MYASIKGRMRALCLLMCIWTVLGYDVTTEQTKKRNRLLERHPRANRVHRALEDSMFGNGASFSGKGEFMRLNLADDSVYDTSEEYVVSSDVSIPSTSFTVMFWTKPEGGQYRYTPIIDVFDECKKSSKNGWTVGIKLPNHKREGARFVFSVHPEGSSKTTHLFAHKPYDLDTWTHVTASFDGVELILYVNGARMSRKLKVESALFKNTLVKCVGLFLGGQSDGDVFFRGKIDEVGLWRRVLNHSEVVQNMNRPSQNFARDSDLIFTEPFDSFDNWEILSDKNPGLVTSEIAIPYHSVRLEAPACGRTICDDPELVLSYLNHSQLREKKRVHYRVINVIGQSLKGSLLSDKHIVEQHRTLENVFKPYGIHLELEQVNIKNDSLLTKVIMFDCLPFNIGNGKCDEECAHSTTGNDAGDCDRFTSECAGALLGNGVCNPECNKAYHNYDSGDCCRNDVKIHVTCIDPTHANRAYIHIEELKMDVQMDGRTAINVFLITSSWNKDNFRGLATYPWEKNVYTSMGGNIMHAGVLGSPGTLKALVHEFGHNFGLWHVHHGVSEMSCDDTCLETHPSMVLGDLCSDTNPTPRNVRCSDPLPSNAKDTCGQYSFRDTPYSNYMSYADDGCTDHFTAQQVARMHCYLDLVYQPMRDMKQPPPVPIAPKIIEASPDRVHIVWLEPLGLSTECDADNALRQYADTATSSHHGVRWAPHQATGFPDAEKCSSSPFSWKPHHSETNPECDVSSCWLQLGFKQAVIPRRLSIWVSDLRHDMDLFVEWMTTSGDVITVTEVPAYCDMETTVVVDINQPVDKVRISTSDSYLAVDAVEMVSAPDYGACLNRQVPKYRLTRRPAFSSGDVITGKTSFVDSDVTPDVTYTYRVQVEMDSRASALSPELTYTHEAAFCGDGTMQEGEECDDRNAIDGDGCSMECRLEEAFICTGSPSLCSVIASGNEECDNSDGTNRCELSAPDGFIDQWAFDAVANPEYQSADCPASMVTGKPDHIQTCTSLSDDDFWRPCSVPNDVNGLFWIQISIYKPVVATAVVVHLASDGRTADSHDVKHVYVELQTDAEAYIPLGTGVPVTCKDNPVHIPVTQDLSKPFFLTKGVRISFTSSSISIHAVRVRSSPYINPPVLSTCSQSQLYNTHVGYCVTGTCESVTCGEYLVKYGTALCSGSTDGDTCQIQCSDGYRIEGHENKATCAGGSWISNTPLHCSPVDCGKPEVPMATTSCPEGVTYSRQCMFKCNKPAILIGDDTSLTCLHTGQWSKPRATCEIQCDALSTRDIRYGKLKTIACSKGPQSVGQQCKVKCQEGFRVEHGRNRRRFLRLICDEEGQWFGPRCVPDTCPPLPTMFAGAYLCTRDFYTGSTCTMACPNDDTAVQSVSCQMDGQWNRHFSVCPGDVTTTCQLPPSSGDLKMSCNGTNPGDVCKVACQQKKRLSVLRRSEPDDHLDLVTNRKLRYVDHVDCTVLGTWEPAVESVECVQQCTEWSIGDGFCDASNNRDICDWDGGDCCPSTVAGGMVLPIPEDCSAQCACKDPRADENIRRHRRHRYLYFT